MFYTFVWGSKGVDIDYHVPLKALSASVAATGTADHTLKIVFLEGIENASPEYLQSISNEHVSILDFQREFGLIKQEFSSVFNTYSVFESYCLLRWICLKKLTQADSTTQVWHLDSDIVLHASLDELAAATSGKTFMLDGCPVLTSIADKRWFDMYEAELKKLLSDPVAYSANAFQTKMLNKQSDAELCNQTLYRNPIGSDQDLLQYLIGSRILPQTNCAGIYGQGFFYIQNPLQIEQKHIGTAGGKMTFEALPGGVIRTNTGHRVPFTHFQGNFVTYCNLYFFLRKIGLPSRLVSRVLAFHIEDEKFRITRAAWVTRVFVNRMKIARPRNRIIHLFSAHNNKLLVEILNHLSQPVVA